MPDSVMTGRALRSDERIIDIVPVEQAGDAEVIDAMGKYTPGRADLHI